MLSPNEDEPLWLKGTVGVGGGDNGRLFPSNYGVQDPFL